MITPAKIHPGRLATSSVSDNRLMSEPSNGRQLIDLVKRWHGDPALDETFEENVRQARLAAGADADPWLD